MTKSPPEYIVERMPLTLSKASSPPQFPIEWRQDRLYARNHGLDSIDNIPSLELPSADWMDAIFNVRSSDVRFKGMSDKASDFSFSLVYTDPVFKDAHGRLWVYRSKQWHPVPKVRTSFFSRLFKIFM